MERYAPIEVVLDVRSYQDNRYRPPGRGGGRDFFSGADLAFAKHQKVIATSLRSASEAIAKYPGEVGYVKVKMRPEALAKSHRPTSALFPSKAAPVVGIEDAGELIIQASAAQLEATARTVLEAEINVDVVEKIDPKTQQITEVPAPTAMRTETSALESVSVWSAADKRAFSAKQATNWAREKKVALRYRVDLFDFVPTKRPSKFEVDATSHDVFFKQLGRVLDGGYFALVHKTTSVTRLYIWLTIDQSIRSITQWQGRSRRKFDEVDLDLKRNETLLGFLDQHPMVRRVALPSSFIRSTGGPTSSPSAIHKFSSPQPGAAYPIVAVIDGGVCATMNDWVTQRVTAVPAAEMDTTHGTEIASLLVDGQRLNNAAVCPEPDGCYIVDIGMMATRDYFSAHYADDQDFLHALNEEVRRAKATTGVRIFCFSHNVEHFVNTINYDELSLGLDQIAADNDVIFVLAAGNLPSGGYRSEWKSVHSDALSDLASSFDDRITAPGDSIFNVSVSALNPPGCVRQIPDAPARYSRRGPGHKGHVKPDVSHYGGHGALTGHPTELRVATAGAGIISVFGTSFSAPLVAKTLARLDQLTDGKVSREALIALCVHGAAIPAPLLPPVFEKVRRDLIGYGRPIPAQPLLAGDPNSATLVFMDELQLKKDMFFQFQWPACLTKDGACKGEARVTLVYTPPVNEAFSAELIRVDLEVSLHQLNVKNAKYDQLRSKNVFKFKSDRASPDNEQELIEESLKWNNVKQVAFKSPKGVGKSSQWQLSLKYLERAEEKFPALGVPFAIVLTIKDPGNKEPVYQDMRAALSAHLVQTADIHALAQTKVTT